MLPTQEGAGIKGIVGLTGTDAIAWTWGLAEVRGGPLITLPASLSPCWPHASGAGIGEGLQVP